MNNANKIKPSYYKISYRIISQLRSNYITIEDLETGMYFTTHATQLACDKEKISAMSVYDVLLVGYIAGQASMQIKL